MAAGVTGYPLGKKSAFAVGDEVELEMQGETQCRILRHQTRRTFLYRSDAWRQKLIAANTTQLILVVATEPDFSDELLARAIIAAESEGMRCLIVLNKCDLLPKLAQTREKLAEYRELGYEVLEISARQTVSIIRPFLHKQSSILVGQSGMGKSTLIQALFPDAVVATREISTALGSGKHTTTHARSYQLDDDSDIIDCPGLQEFGLGPFVTSADRGRFPGISSASWEMQISRLQA
jgi:ribosome biogenesis GTPase